MNVCGNTVNVAGLLNPAAGNGCANVSEGGGPGVGGGATAGSGEGAGGVDRGGAVTRGGAVAVGSEDSPGVLSGNGLQLPVHLPVNLSGNSVSVVGLGNPSVGNTSTNTSGDHPRAGEDRPEAAHDAQGAGAALPGPAAADGLPRPHRRRPDDAGGRRERRPFAGRGRSGPRRVPAHGGPPTCKAPPGTRPGGAPFGRGFHEWSPGGVSASRKVVAQDAVAHAVAPPAVPEPHTAQHALAGEPGLLQGALLGDVLRLGVRLDRTTVVCANR